MQGQPYAKLAKLLSDKLNEKRINQPTVAAWCGVSQAAVSFWRNGDKRPQPAHVAKLIMLLDLDLKKIAAIGGYDEEDILRFLPYSLNVWAESDYAEQLVGQIREAISQGNRERAIQRVRHLSAWLDGSSLPFKEPPNNLPELKDNLVNQRDAEERVLKELDSRWPIIAIEGPPGGSKSTLAIQVGRQCLMRNRRALHIPFDAVIWVSAKDRPDQGQWLDEVVDRVTRLLGYPCISNLSKKVKRQEGLNLLRSCRVLLIIDNYETIHDPELEEWLQQVPEPSKVLITSLPNQLRTARPVVLQGLSQAGRVALLQQRAQDLQLYNIDDVIRGNESSLVEISDGNPKVIEVALGTAKYEQRSLREIVTLLQSTNEAIQQLEILLTMAWNSSGRFKDRERVPMPRSALPAPQRLLVAMLFFVETVSKEALAVTANVAEVDLDPALTQLVEMGLIDAHLYTESAMARFSIHPVVRTFVSKKSVAMPQFEAQARADWYGYFLAYVEHYGDDDRGECIGYGREGYREKLTAELPNIRASIEWCFRHRPEQAVRIVERITTYLLDEGFFRERLDVSQRAYDIAKILEMWKSQVGLLVRKGWTELVMGEWETAEKTYRQAIALARDYKVKDRLVQALRDLGHLFALRGTLARENKISEADSWFADAEQLIAESLVLAQETRDNLGILEARAFAARVAYLRGDVAHVQEAKRAFCMLLTECQAVRQWRHLLFIHRYLAQIALIESDLAKAQQHLDLANEILQKRYYEAHEEAQNMECQGDIEATYEDWDQARATYIKARDLTLRRGMKHEQMRIQVKLQKLATSP